MLAHQKRKQTCRLAVAFAVVGWTRSSFARLPGTIVLLGLADALPFVAGRRKKDRRSRDTRTSGATRWLGRSVAHCARSPEP